MYRVASIFYAREKDFQFLQKGKGDGQTLTAKRAYDADGDLLTSAESNNILIAGNGSQTLIGGDGNDILMSGTGTQVLEGGKGDDTYVIESANVSVSEAQIPNSFDTADIYVQGAFHFDNLELIDLFTPENSSTTLGVTDGEIIDSHNQRQLLTLDLSDQPSDNCGTVLDEAGLCTFKVHLSADYLNHLSSHEDAFKLINYTSNSDTLDLRGIFAQGELDSDSAGRFVREINGTKEFHFSATGFSNSQILV